VTTGPGNPLAIHPECHALIDSYPRIAERQGFMVGSNWESEDICVLVLPSLGHKPINWK
jgi:hypothetical protein